MIYVKFDANNISTEMRSEVDSAELNDYIHVEDNTLFGKRLVKLDNGVREFTQAEYDDEAAAIDRKQKAMVIDNMAREMLKQSNELIGPDLYEDLSKDKKAAVKKYREALRDINKQETYPEYVEFPDKPII
jgi:hypothetical protein